MSSADKNLSDYHLELDSDPSELKIIIVVSEWNDEITSRLFQGCTETLVKLGVDAKNIESIKVPGSFELPMGAQMAIESSDPLPNAVICLGCVIRGETDHFQYVSSAVSNGIQQVSLKYNLPVVFGVLTDDNKQQSLDRSGGKHGNKGDEAAVTAVKMSLIQRKLWN